MRVTGALVSFFKAGVRRWGRWFLARRGEARVAEILKSLPDDYVLLNDLVLPGSKGNIDHVLIGPNGVFAIQTKNYSGFVKCEDDQWLVNGRPIRSLSKQAKRNSMAVRGCIASLFPAAKNNVPYVVPLMIFVGSGARLKLFKPTLSILRLNELVEFIRRRETPRLISAGERQAIVQHLQLFQCNFAETSDWSATVEECVPSSSGHGA
jgi:hypothetical protein